MSQIRFRLWSIILLLVLVCLLSACGDATSSNATATQPSTPTARPTQATRPTPTATKPKKIVATHGSPHIGGPISDFYGKYGQPTIQGTGNSQTWIADQSTTTIVNATPDGSGKTIGVIVTTGANWNNDQTKQYCSQFLPPDASQFNTVDNLTDYNSSAGEIVMQLSQASCVLTIAGQ